MRQEALVVSATISTGGQSESNGRLFVGGINIDIIFNLIIVFMVYIKEEAHMQAQEIDWNNVPPQHPVCGDQVEVPTIRLQPRGQGYPNRPPEFEGQEEIVVQWFGENSLRDLGKRNLQFAFPLMTRPDAVQWFGRPEWYRTVMLGPLHNWPNKEAFAKMVLDGRDPDETVIYAITSNIGLDDGRGGVRPSALIVGVVNLGDPVHGIIRPREFANWNVSAEEIEKLARAR